MLAFFEKTYDTSCGDGEHGSSEKKVTIENLEFHVQGQIELTRTPAKYFVAPESSNCCHWSVHDRVLTWNTRIVQAIVYCRLAHV